MADVLRTCGAIGDLQLEESLLADLAADTLANRRALARKAPLLDRSLTPLMLAITIELAGQVMIVQ